MNNQDAAKLSMSQATIHLRPSIFISTLIILTLSGKKTPPNSESQKAKDYLFLPLLWQFLSLPNLISTSAAALPSSVFLHFSLPHLLAFPSILVSLPHRAWSSGKPTHAQNQTSINQRLFSHPYTSLTRSDFRKRWKFFQTRVFSLGKRDGAGARGCWSKKFFRSRSQD